MASSFAVLKPGGRAAFIASGGEGAERRHAPTCVAQADVGRDRPHLERIVALVAAGRSVRRRSRSSAKDAAAQRISEGRHFRGKLVFKVR